MKYDLLKEIMVVQNSQHPVIDTLAAEQAALIMLHAEFKFQQLKEGQNLASFFAAACLHPKLTVIGINEIFINSIEHGNLGISFEEKTKLQATTTNWVKEIEKRINLPENKNKYVHVTFTRNTEHIRLQVKDEGNGFDWKKFQALDSARIHDHHGRGILMARNLAFDRLEFSAKGNEVDCYIKINI